MIAKLQFLLITLICIALVMFFRVVGIFAAFAVCTIAVRYVNGADFRSFKMTATPIGVQLIIPMAILVLSIVFLPSDTGHNLAVTLANSSVFKLPADRVVLALYTNDNAYENLRLLLTNDPYYERFNVGHFGPLLLAIVSSLTLFAVLLPYVFFRAAFRRFNFDHLSGARPKIGRVAMSFLCFMLLVSLLPLIFDGWYVSRYGRNSDIYIYLVWQISFLALHLAAEILGAKLNPNLNVVDDKEIQNG